MYTKRERERESIIHIAHTGRGGELECGVCVCVIHMHYKHRTRRSARVRGERACDPDRLRGEIHGGRGGKEWGREGGREGGKEGGREGARVKGSERGEAGTQRRREGGREGGGEGVVRVCHTHAHMRMCASDCMWPRASAVEALSTARRTHL
jgi:hypothetical protein